MMRSCPVRSLSLLACLPAATLLATPLAAETTHFLQLPAPIGTAQLVLPTGQAGPVPLVVLMPDALGEDGRAEPYVAALAARGIATLVVGLDGDPDQPRLAWDPASEPALVAPVQAWALGEVRVIAAGRIGVLGFGAGARGALAAPAAGPTAALYPGCTGLSLPDWRPVLLLYPERAADAATCQALEEPPAAVITPLPGAGHAWDARLGPQGQRDYLPAPDGAGRLLAWPSAEASLRAAVLISGWFAQQLTVQPAVQTLAVRP